MRTRQIITALVLALILGLHWAALQSAAWVSMIVRYAEHETFATAVRMTFDGRHPCALCRLVADGKESEQKQRQTQLTVLKLIAVCEAPLSFVFQDTPPDPFELLDQHGLARFERPPFPPPRLV